MSTSHFLAILLYLLCTRICDDMRLIEKCLQILVCEVDSAYSNMPQTVALRSSQDTYQERDEFLTESRLLASLQHPNVIRLMGVSMSEEPYCSVLEHSAQGDLYSYLRRHRLPTSTTTSSSSSSSSNNKTENNLLEVISHHRLLDWASQIASGMKYLDSRGIIHKDIATR